MTSSGTNDGIIRAAYDFDSTVWPIMDVMKHLTGDHRFDAETMSSWYHPVEYAGGDEAFADLTAKSCRLEVMKRFAPFPGAIPALNRFQDRQVELTLLTARPDGTLDAVIDTLALHGHKPHQAVLCSGHDKVQYCLDRGIGILADDAPHTIELACQAGLPIATLLWGYNKDVVKRYHVPHATSWAGLEFIMAQMLGFH
jgi:hypothetical protein